MSNNNTAEALGVIPSGLFIIRYPSTEKDDVIEGMLVSWVQQVSFDPLMISMAVAKKRTDVLSSLSPGQLFEIAVLGDNNRSMMSTLFKEGISSCNLSQCIATMKVQVVEIINAKQADHSIVTAQILESQTNKTPDNNRAAVHTRKSALNY